MLARKMKLKLNGLEVGTTPMLVPAFSSKANIDICKTIETTSESINGPILISAYDVNYAEEFPPITFPDLIFLDSGGYGDFLLSSGNRSNSPMPYRSINL